MGSISVRKSIKWLPGEASEPTSTIVLTSPQRRFVDLRIFNSAAKVRQDEALDPAYLEWGIAGTSSSTAVVKDGEAVNRGRWNHWIDSRTTEEVFDEGDIFPLSATTTLEKGRMINPDTGLDTAFEEVWEDTEPETVPSTIFKCAVLRMEEKPESRGLMIFLGKHCQALVREGDSVSAERWLHDGGVWTRQICMGSLGLPCSEIIAKLSALSLGKSSEINGQIWLVVEVSE